MELKRNEATGMNESTYAKMVMKTVSSKCSKSNIEASDMLCSNVWV